MIEVRTAGILRRGAALAVDGLVAILVILLGYAVGVFEGAPFRPPPDWFWTEWWFKYWLDDPRVFFDPVIGFAVVLWLWTAAWDLAAGRTPGDRLLSIELVDSDGDRPSPLRNIARSMAVLLNVGSLGLGWLWIVVSPTRRAWHDYLSGTWVVRSK